MQRTDVDGDGREQREVRAKLQKKGDVTTQHLMQVRTSSGGFLITLNGHSSKIQLLRKRKVEEYYYTPFNVINGC